LIDGTWAYPASGSYLAHLLAAWQKGNRPKLFTCPQLLSKNAKWGLSYIFQPGRSDP
jgi:hypothetical protein